MNKKIIVVIVLIILIVGASVYFVMSKKKEGALASDNSRGEWAAEDDALYNSLRSQFNESELNWIDPIVKQKYDANTFVEWGTINGKLSKSGAFVQTLYEVNPNDVGKEAPMPGVTKPSLWPPSKLEAMYKQVRALKVKYNHL